MAHRHCDEIGKSSKTQKKGRKQKNVKKNAIKICRAFLVRFIIIFLPFFFIPFLFFFSFFLSVFFFSIATKGTKLNEVNRFAKKSSRLRYSLYSSRVSIYVRNAPSGIGSIRHCSPTMSDQKMNLFSELLFTCLFVYLSVCVSHPLFRRFISRFARYIFLSLSLAGTFPFTIFNSL